MGPTPLRNPGGTGRQPGSQAARQPGSQAARQPGSQAARQPGSHPWPQVARRRAGARFRASGGQAKAASYKPAVGRLREADRRRRGLLLHLEPRLLPKAADSRFDAGRDVRTGGGPIQRVAASRP